MRSALALLIATAAIVGGCGAAASTDGFVEIPGIGATRVDVPRPSSGVSAPCDSDPLPNAGGDSIEDRVAALRDIGLFADRVDRSDAEVAAEVEAALGEVWGDALPADDPIFELAIAETDRDRVWWRDLEADVVEDNQVYVETIASWGDISVGTFDPVDIAERWDGPTGPVSVRFTHDGMPHDVSPAYLEDWIDPRILDRVNAAIEGSDRRFHLYKAFDQSAFVLALTDAEREALEDRGWCFE